MKYLLLILPILASTSVFAQAEILRLLNQANSLNLSGESSQCTEGTDAAELRACAVSLCGPAETVKTAMLNDRNFDLYVTEGITDRFQEIEEVVKKVHEKKQKGMRSVLEAFQKHLDSGTPLFKFNEWTYEYGNFTYSLFDSHIEKSVDLTKPVSERLTIVVSPPAGSSEIFKKGLQSYAESLKKAVATDIGRAMYDDIYTLEEALEIFNKLRSDFLIRLEEEKKKNPGVLSDRPNLSKFVTGEELKLATTYDVASSYHDLFYLNQSLSIIRNEPVTYSTGTDCTEDCKAAIRDELTRIDFKEILSKIAKLTDETGVEKSLASCKAELISKGLKQSDNEKFLAEMPGVKEDFINKVVGKYSSHSKEAFRSFLEKDLHLVFSNRSGSSVDEFVESLKKAATEPEAALDSTSLSLASKLLQMKDSIDKDYFSDLKACSAEDNFVAWDAYNNKENGNPEEGEEPGKDNIYVSLFSCTHVGSGKGIFAHEIGHALSNAFQKKRLSTESEIAYMSMRSCVTKSHVSFNTSKFSNELTRKGESLYTEEDTADVVGFAAVEDDKSIFTCALLRTNSAGTDYEELSFANKEKMDTHSSALLRVVREALYKKVPLSPACQNLVDKNKNSFKFDLCP